MSIKNFENKRWETGDQKKVFRHFAALEMIKSGRLIDLGCGDGLFLEMARRNGLEVMGLDISDEAVNKCRAKGIEARQSDLESEILPFADNEFDYCTILDNLEHLFNPDKLLKEASRVAKRVIISVPNFNSLPARLQMLLGTVPENNRPNKGHVYWFNYYILNKMIEDNGLNITEFNYNTVWEKRFVIGRIMKFLSNRIPNLFALSLIVKVEKK